MTTPEQIAEIDKRHNAIFDGHIRRDESIPQHRKDINELLIFVKEQAAEIERLKAHISAMVQTNRERG